MKKNIVCIISGPTATGKTALSIELAKKFGGEIVNFDSLLFYKELNIGSAKPTAQQMAGVVHHMIDIQSIKNPINAADFLELALPLIEAIHNRGQIVYLVGGSGFYLQALLYGMFDSGTTPPEIQQRSESLYAQAGIAPFIEILRTADTESFEKYHENDHYRIRRAVEHYWSTGTKFSQSRKKMDQVGPDCPWVKYEWSIFHAHLDIPKPEHETIIGQRATQMIDAGLIDEVKKLLHLGFSGQEKPLQSIGHKETLEYLAGKITSLNDLITRITIATRQLAKAQRTWFKKQVKNSYNPLTERESLIVDFQKFLDNLTKELP